MRNKYKKLIFLIWIAATPGALYSQVGISNQDPKGVLDLRTDGANNTTGLVIPRIQDVANLKNADGDEAIEATIAYDISDECMKYKGANAWSDCMLDNQSVNRVTGSILNIGNDLKMMKASAGNWFTVAIGKNDQALYVSGYGTEYRTALGRVSLINSFTLVKADTPIADASAGYTHGLAAAENGKVFAWGNNTSGRTGVGVITSYTTVPTELPNWVVSSYGRAVRVEAGYLNSLILSEQGKVYSMGDASLTGMNTQYAVPTLISTLPSSTVFTEISLSQTTAGAIDSTSSTVYVWGNNIYGQLGTGSGATITATPQAVTFPKTIGQLAMGIYNSAAVSTDQKTLYVWGLNTVNGIGGVGNTTSPTALNIPGFDSASDVIYDIAVDRFYSGGIMVATSAGVYVAGNNPYRRLGAGSTDAAITNLTKINSSRMYAGTVIKDVSLGFFQSVMISGDNTQNTENSYSAYGSGGLEGYRELGAINSGGPSYVPTLITY
ncbi:RCC1 domain-containing protein [Chryseobacterium sp. CT-SW4]|uniref:RCC1 domain-containing protein n=1 Tax=Chryseobacterium sp. SW-1 TaxID=3157343 RepID=UPI003B024DB5